MKRKFWNWVKNEGERTLFLNGEISDETWYFSFEVERAIEHYYGKSNHFYEWLLEETYDLLEDAFDDYLVQLWIGDKYEDVVDKIAEEMFYILFLNRDFLLYFNQYMSRTHGATFHVYTCLNG